MEDSATSAGGRRHERIEISITEHPGGYLLYETTFRGVKAAGVARDYAGLIAAIQQHQAIVIQMKVETTQPEGWVASHNGLDRPAAKVTNRAGNPVPTHTRLVRGNGYVRVLVQGEIGITVSLDDEALLYMLAMEPS